MRPSAPATAAVGAVIACSALGACTPGPIEVATLPTDTLSSGLAAHWTFDEGTGATVGDSSGNGRDGALTGGSSSWVASGRFGSALYFGGGDTVSVAGFPPATPAFTVSAWLRLSADDLAATPYGLAALLSNETSTGGWGIYLQLATPVAPVDPTYLFSYYVGAAAGGGSWPGPGPGPTPNPSSAPPGYAYVDCACFVLGSWVHVAAVVDANTGEATLFVSGAPASRVSVSAGISPGQRTLLMGRWPGMSGPPRALVGAVDDVAIWTRALAPEEISLLTQAPAPIPF